MFVQSLSCVWILATPWAAIHQSPLSFTNSPGFCVNLCPLSWWCYLNISSLSLASPPALHLSQHQGLFWWVCSLHQVAKFRSFSFIYLPMNIQGWFPFGLTGLFSLLPKGVSRVFSSSTKSINSSMLNLLYGLTLTSIHYYWKNHSFDYIDHCQQSDVSAF